MCVLSNNTHRKRIDADFNEKIPNYINDLLSFLEEWTSIYKIRSEVERNYINIILEQRESKKIDGKIRVIKLTICNEPKFYLINIYERCNNNLSLSNSENREEIYQIKVEGDYEMSSVKNDIKKFIKKKNFTHYNKYYPF
jgi:hypothetical protein